MKKVILCAVALMIGGFAFAQTPVQPTAAEHIAILPGAAATANSGQSQQNGNDHRVQVIQAGTNQSASTYQSDGVGTGGNLAYISQIGAVQAASGVQNDAEVRQVGTENESTTDQQGDYNSALTRQGLNNDSSRNKAWIRQGTNEQAENNMSEINQDGDDNLAKTLQTYDNNEALINQLGDDNKAFSIQDGGPEGTDGHAAEMDQMGDRNEAWAHQSGNGARNNAVVFQIGDDNESQQIQVNTAASGGSMNYAAVSQGDGARDGWALNGSIWIGQLQTLDDITTGTFNGPSYGATAYQKQQGTANQAEVHQFGGASQNPPGNYAEQNQTGDSNDALVQQNSYGSPAGGANYARQDQDGDGNQAGIAQNGVNHKIWQTQDGDYNIAMSTQRGECNEVNIHQLGDQNVAHTAQRGQDNGILIVQDGGQSYSVTQNLPNGNPFGMPNGNNSVNVLQLGPNGTDPGIDCSFENRLDTPRNYDVPDLTIADVCPGC